MSDKKSIDIGLRIEQIRKHLGLSVREFADVLGITSAHVYGMQKGSRAVGIKTADFLFEKYRISLTWLYHGAGPMTISPTADVVSEPESQYLTKPDFQPAVEVVDTSHNPQVAVIDAKAAAGYPRHYLNQGYMASMPVMSLPFPDLRDKTHIAIQIDGNSMENTIQHMDYVVCHQVLNWSDMKRGHIYAVVTPDGIICKRMVDQRGESYLQLKSDNPAYGDEVIQTSQVMEVWRVRYKISSNLRRIEPVDLSDIMNRMEAQVQHVNQFLDRFFDERAKQSK